MSLLSVELQMGDNRGARDAMRPYPGVWRQLLRRMAGADTASLGARFASGIVVLKLA